MRLNYAWIMRWIAPVVFLALLALGVWVGWFDPSAARPGLARVGVIYTVLIGGGLTWTAWRDQS